jgi:hypothetical protein
MLSTHELEGTRRSAAMAPLSQEETQRLIDGALELARERERIANVLRRLPTSFASVRDCLNELQSIVRT